MIVVLASLVLVAVVAAVAGGVLRSMVRQHARERQLLLDRICHLAGKTWNPPPASGPVKEPEARATVRNPEQYPDDYDFELDPTVADRLVNAGLAHWGSE